MGRELRRREERKNKKLIANKEVELDTSIKAVTVFKVIFAIVLILLVLYYVLAVFVTKEIDVSGGKNSDATDEVSSGVSNKILASAMFHQSEEVYYVYFYDFSDADESITSALNNKSDLKFYRVDTSSSLNGKYVTEEAGNRNVTGVEDLKVKSPTMIQVTNDQVTAYYEGSSEILAFLNS